MKSDPERPSALGEDVAVFREFNRVYTRFIGTLDEGLLRTEFSLAEARVLYELATRTEPTAKKIAETLGMDQGYLSRMLAKFEAAVLLRRKAAKEDSRRAQLTLTQQGRSAFRRLNALSEKQAAGILGSMSPQDRGQLLGSMQTIRRIVMGKEVSGEPAQPFILRPHRVGDMGWVVSREGAVYAEEYGWDDTFEALVARIVADFLMNFDAKRERCWMADVNGQSVGHIFLVKHPEQPDTAKLRLLFVEPSARGLGLGQALVDECIRFARAAGYRRVTLWTQSILSAAHRIYERTGFRLVAQEPHHSFGKDLIGQTWELELTAVP
jgi:DNA-binding MarR family transcriptional regulator/GNAT superfamily N-acetyltransferase